MDFILKNNLKKSYDHDAIRRSQSEKQTWKIKERETFLKLLSEEMKQTLLEVGAGTGTDSKYFSDKGFITTSIDLSDQMIQMCRDQGLNAFVMDFFNMEFPENSFDAVYALNCLLHVPKDDILNVFTEIKRVLKRDGLFYMGVYGGIDSEGVWEDDLAEPKRFFSFYQDEAIKQVVAQVFDIEYFQIVPLEQNKLHFQSFILRNRK